LSFPPLEKIFLRSEGDELLLTNLTSRIDSQVINLFMVVVHSKTHQMTPKLPFFFDYKNQKQAF
jgi:hypothetical protein